MNQLSLFNRKVFMKDVIIAIIIVALPFLFYLYNLVPSESIWTTRLFTIDSSYYDDVSVFAWTLMTKLMTFGFLSIWYITCKHWWRNAILIPIVIEIYKILVILDDEIQFLDNNEFIMSIPVTLPIIILLVYLSKKLNYFSLSKSLGNQLDDEIDNMIQELAVVRYKEYSLIKEKFELLKSQKQDLNKIEYLKKLIALKNNLIFD